MNGSQNSHLEFVILFLNPHYLCMELPGDLGGAIVTHYGYQMYAL